MKIALISLLVALTSFAAQARPGRFDRRPVERPQTQICVFNLEKEAYTGRSGWTYQFEESFTEFGPRACFMAEEACERIKSRKRDYWNYRCEKEFTNGGRPQFGESCEYKIQTRRGVEPEVFTSRGFGACGLALDKCSLELRRKQNLGLRNRHLGGVGPAAQCVQTSLSRPDPRPPRVTASCNASIFIEGRYRHRAYKSFTESASGRNYSRAREKACSAVMATCRANTRGPMFCEIVD